MAGASGENAAPDGMESERLRQELVSRKFPLSGAGQCLEAHCIALSLSHVDQRGCVSMSTTPEEYLKRAEECERLASECQSDSNRKIFLDIAAKWRSMAADAAVGPTTREDGAGKPAGVLKLPAAVTESG